MPLRVFEIPLERPVVLASVGTELIATDVARHADASVWIDLASWPPRAESAGGSAERACRSASGRWLCASRARGLRAGRGGALALAAEEPLPFPPAASSAAERTFPELAAARRRVSAGHGLEVATFAGEIPVLLAEGGDRGWTHLDGAWRPELSLPPLSPRSGARPCVKGLTLADGRGAIVWGDAVYVHDGAAFARWSHPPLALAPRLWEPAASPRGGVFVRTSRGELLEVLPDGRLERRFPTDAAPDVVVGSLSPGPDGELPVSRVDTRAQPRTARSALFDPRADVLREVPPELELHGPGHAHFVAWTPAGLVTQHDALLLLAPRADLDRLARHPARGPVAG